MPFITIRMEDETKFSNLSILDESKLGNHMEKVLHAMDSSQGLRSNNKYTSIVINQLHSERYPPDNPLYSTAQYYIGLKDFTDKLLQLTSYNLHSHSDNELLLIPAFDENCKFNF